MKRPVIVVSLMLVVLCVAVGAYATPLTDLLNGGSIIAGDKLFDQWQLVSYAASDPSRGFNAANIDVQAITDGGLNPGPGLSFIAANNELSVTGDGIYAFVDLMFGFRVSILDPTLKIKDNSLWLNGWTLEWMSDGSNDLGVYIRETVGTAPGLDDLGVKNVERSVLDDVLSPDSKLFDSAVFPPQSQIWVTKNILVWSVDPTDTAALTGFDQRFSQVIPEPSTYALLCISLGVIGFVRRKTRKQ